MEVLRRIDLVSPAYRRTRAAITLAIAFAAAGLSLNARAATPIQVRNVAQGSASFSQVGNQTVVRTSANTVINYTRFNVPANNVVEFVQPSPTSRVLNRITDAVPSRIDGSIISNGTVYLVNPAGVTFGPNSVINTGGFIAAAGHISDADFLGGVNHFTGVQGAVVNQGLIQSNQVTLVGQCVVNSGTILVPNGAVAMAAGDDVYITQREGRVTVKVAAPPAAPAGNAGAAQNDAPSSPLTVGDMYSAAMRRSARPSGATASNLGVIRAGEVAIHGQNVEVSGKVDASNAAGKGGPVTVTGSYLAVTGAIDASGTAGGGTVKIGGDQQGQGPLPNAKGVYVAPTATIRADGIGTGSGGTVIVFGTDTARIYGLISAKGGSLGGDGGYVETSGKKFLDITQTPDVTSAAGKAGAWLIDPDALNIVLGNGTTNINGASPFSTSGDPATLGVDRIVNALTGGASVTVTANGASPSITLSTALDYTGKGTNSLAFIASGGTVSINAPISGGPADNLNLTLNTATLNLNNTVSVGTAGSLIGSGINTVNVSGTGSINSAIALVSSGHTVNVAAGTYTEAITINKSVTLLGANHSVVADGVTARSPESIIDASAGPMRVQADNVTVSGFTISGNTNGAGLVTSPSFSGYAISNNIITGNTYGVDLGSSGVLASTFSNNYVHHNNAGAGGALGDGIYADQGIKNFIIQSNVIGNNDSAAIVIVGTAGAQSDVTIDLNALDNTIVLASVTRFTISNNSIDTSGIAGGPNTAIFLAGSNNIGTISGNDIKGTKGVYFADPSIFGYAENTGTIDIKNNNFTGNTNAAVRIDAGAVLTATATVKVNNNSISSNTAGLVNDSTVVVDATNNWWGSVNGPSYGTNNTFTTTLAGTHGDSISGTGAAVTFVPWLGDGTNNPPSPPGFYPTPGGGGGPAGSPVTPVANINSGVKFASIQKANDAAGTLDTHQLQIAAGYFSEDASISKALYLNVPSGTTYANSWTSAAGKTISLSGSFATRISGVGGNGFVFNGDVVLKGNTTLRATGGTTNPDSVSFNGAVNGDGVGSWSLSVDTSYAGAAVNAAGGTIQFGDGVGNDYIGAVQPLKSLTTTAAGKGSGGPGNTLFQMADTANPSVTTTLTQTYHNPVVLKADTVLTSLNAGAITIDQTVDSDALATPRALTVNTAGTTWFKGDVGAGANGIDNLGMGDDRPLASLTTDAGGLTQLGNGTTIGILTLNINAPATTGNVTFNDPVVLQADTTVHSVFSGTPATHGGNIVFNDTVISLPDATSTTHPKAYGLTVTMNGPTRVNDSDPNKTEYLNQDKSVFNGGVSFGNTVAVKTLSVTSNRDIYVGPNVSELSTTGDLSLQPNAGTALVNLPASGNTSSATMPQGYVVLLGGTSDGTSYKQLVSNSGNINIAASVRQDVPAVASVLSLDKPIQIKAEAGTVTFGQNEKISSFSSVTITAKNITIGDVTAGQSLTIHATDLLTVRSRTHGDLLNNSGRLDASLTDRSQATWQNENTDFVSLGAISISAGHASGLIKASNPAADASILIGGAPGYASVQKFPQTDPSQLKLVNNGNTLVLEALDLKAEGPATDNPGGALAGALPTPLPPVGNVLQISVGDLKKLRDSGINARVASTNEMIESLLGRAIYDDAFYKGTAGDVQGTVPVTKRGAGNVYQVVNRFNIYLIDDIVKAYTALFGEYDQTLQAYPRRTEITSTIGDSIKKYRKTTPNGPFDPQGFLKYLDSTKATPASAQSLEYLGRLSDFRKKLQALNLTPLEFRHVRDRFLGDEEYGVPAEQLEQVLEKIKPQPVKEQNAKPTPQKVASAVGAQ